MILWTYLLPLSSAYSLAVRYTDLISPLWLELANGAGLLSQSGHASLDPASSRAQEPTRLWFGAFHSLQGVYNHTRMGATGLEAESRDAV